MVIPSDESEALEEPVAEKKKIPILVLFLSVLLGVLLTASGVGGFFLFQKAQGLRQEILAARSELVRKSQDIEDLRDQIESLSGQMQLLRDYSIARSTSPETKGNEPAKTQSAPAPPVPPVPEATNKKDVAAKTAEAPREKKSKPSSLSCDLTGKSPEEQAAILQRCVGAMETGKGKRP